MTVQDLLKAMWQACSNCPKLNPQMTIFLGRKTWIEIAGDIDIRPYCNKFPLKFNGADVLIVNVDEYLKVIAE